MTLYYDSKWKYYKYVTSAWSQPANPSGISSTIGNGSGGSNSSTYTSSVSFNAVWVKRLRFRLIAGNDEPTTSYPTRIRFNSHSAKNCCRNY